MSMNNAERIIIQTNAHIANINKAFKEVKSDISANYICSNNREIIITTNKVAASLDLNIVEKYMKELNNVDLNNVISPRLLQLKSYLKILSVPYFIEDTNLPITSNIIKRVIKSIHIFDNMVLALYSYIIKASLKSDIAIVLIFGIHKLE